MFDRLFIDLDAQAGAGRNIEIPIADLKRLFNDLVAEWILGDIQFQERDFGIVGTGDVRE